MTNSELTIFFDTIRELDHTENLLNGFYYPEICYFDSREDCNLNNAIYIGKTVRDQVAYINLVFVENINKIFDLTKEDLQMIKVFYVKSEDTAMIAYTKFANYIWEFYKDL